MSREFDKFVQRTRNFFEKNAKVDKEVLYLYNKGENDRHIAKKLNKKFDLSLTGKHIGVWRKLNNLSANHTYGNKSCEIDERVGEKIIALNDQGLSNIQIANKLHISHHKIQKWRLENGVYSRTKKLKSVEENYRHELYNEGMTDKEIAEKTKRSVRTIQGWRQKKGLSSNRSRSGKHKN